MSRLVCYCVTYGVTSRHLWESVGTFEKLKDARQAYDNLPLSGNFKAKRLTRLSFPDKWQGADNVTTVCEVVA